MRSIKRLVSLMLTLCLLLGCASADGIATPTDITPPPTEEPSQPTEPPAKEPVWDESVCQHNTEQCERAPKCDIPGCAHITKDAHGLDVPACSLGEWLLDAQDNPNPVMTLSVRADVIDLNTANAKIYRSGTYRVRGGNLRPGASLTVAKNRVVVLEMEDVTLGTLTAESGSVVYIRTKGQNALTTLTAQSDNQFLFTAGGALTIQEIKQSEKKPASFEVMGGSLKAPLTEKNGLMMTSFPASGVKSVTVAGAPYEATPHADGMLYLWLSAPAAGMKWTATQDGTALAVTQTADLRQEAADIRLGEDNVLSAGTYELSGDIPAGTHLTIGKSGVTVVLDGVTATGTLIDATVPYTLHITGSNTIDTLSGGSVTLQGDGLLTVQGTLPAATFASGRYVLANLPAGYAAFTVGYALKEQAVTLDGEACPLLMTASGALLLPIPASGKTYAITADAANITVRTVEEGELAFTLTADQPVADAGDAAAFTVAGDGSYVTGRITASGQAACAAFHDVRLQGDKALLSLTDEHLTVTLTGDNTLQASSGNAIVLSGDSTLVLNAASGRLALRGQTDLTGITLEGNILVEPASSLPHPALIIRDRSGNPVPNKDLTVSIGGRTWQYTTHYDGSLHLWGLGDISGQEIAATDGENVYTAVVVNNQAQLTTGLTEFSDVTFQSLADGTLLISWAVPGAGTTGVQLLYGATAVDMPDTFVAGAKHITGKDFSAKVTGIPAGSVVTVRVYATEAVGAAFNEQTADGFQFGRVFTHVHRLPWRYEGQKGDADADYTGKAYQPKIDLPDSAVVSYSGHDLVGGKPVYPGDYVMHVTVPEGDPKWQAGAADIEFTIKKLTVTIVPGYNLQKYRGYSDPELTWTAKGLLDGDTVSGVLTREAGEEVGEYKWLTTGFHAPDYYDLRIDPDAAPFLILPVTFSGVIQVDEIMHPVEQTITLRDGRKLTVLLNAQESLTVTHSVLGTLVRNENDEPRLFTPQLSWNPDTDEVLLMMRAEPEMNKDHGYQTDESGNPLWGLRRIRVIGSGLEHMNRMGITALTLINKEASITCRIEDFLTEEMAKAVKEAGGSFNSAAFWLTVEPTQEMPEGFRAVTDGWKVSATMVIGKQEIDITALLPSLTVAVDMEPVAELLAGVDRYDEELFPAQFMLQMADGTALETTFVEPFVEEELEKAAFPSMMYVNRYLSAPLTAPGTIYAVNAPAQEAPEETAGPDGNG